MDPPPMVNHYDPDRGWYSQWDISYEVEIRSESVPSAAPEAEEGPAEEGEPVLVDDVNCEGNINQKGDQEGDSDQKDNIGFEGGMGHDAHGIHEVDGDHEGGGGNQEPGQQLAEMAHVVAPTAPQHGDPQPRIRRRKFRPDQRQELESIFEHTQYPDLLTRRDIARRIGTTEARVQVWFKNRRAREWRNERLLILRNALPATLNQPFVMVLEKP